MQKSINHILSQEKGFTLIELAISLTIIGILLGSVLLGGELITNTRATKTVIQVNEYKAALTTFRGLYGGIPGDITNVARIPNCSTTPLCATPGNGDRYVMPYQSSIPTISPNLTGFLGNAETKQFWLHMQKAGLIKGVSDTGTASPAPFEFGYEIPAAPIKNAGFIAYASTITSAGTPWPPVQNNIIQLVSTSAFSTMAKQAVVIDRKMDDGMPFSGDVLVSAGGTCPITNTLGAEYNESSTSASCDLAFLLTR